MKHTYLCNIGLKDQKVKLNIIIIVMNYIDVKLQSDCRQRGMMGRALRPLGGCRSLSGHRLDVEVGVLSCQDVERHISLPHTRYFRVGALSERWCHSPQQGGYLADKARAWCRHRWQCLVRVLYVSFFYSFWYFYNVWHGILPFGYLCLILGMGYFLT